MDGESYDVVSLVTEFELLVVPTRTGCTHNKRSDAVKFSSFACGILFAGTVVAPVVLPSQSVAPRQRPYIATSKRTIYVVQPGQPEVVKDVVRSTEARDSQGRRYSSAGSNVPPQFQYDWIRDVVTGRSFRVNRERKQAYYTNLDPLDSGPNPAHPEMASTEVRGIPCLRGPLREARPDRSGAVTGTICASPELGNLVVYGENVVNLGGQNLRIVTEVEEFRIDTEPPGEWFEIPADFQLIEGEPWKPAPRN